MGKTSRGLYICCIDFSLDRLIDGVVNGAAASMSHNIKHFQANTDLQDKIKILSLLPELLKMHITAALADEDPTQSLRSR